MSLVTISLHAHFCPSFFPLSCEMSSIAIQVRFQFSRFTRIVPIKLKKHFMQFYNLSWDSNDLWFHAHACLKCSCNHSKSKRTIKLAMKVVWFYRLFSLQYNLILCFLPRLFLVAQLQLGQMMGKDKKTGNHNDLTTHLAFLSMIEDKMQQAARKKISVLSWVFCLCAAAAAESGLIYKSHWCHLSGIVLEYFFLMLQVAVSWGKQMTDVWGESGKECLWKQQMNYSISHQLGPEKYLYYVWDI